VIDALRGPPLFAATEMRTMPGPLPLSPEAIVTHAAPLAELHAHPLGADTAMSTAPPAGAKF
jgi:hypothetical protein